MVRMLLTFIFTILPWGLSSAITPGELRRLIETADVAGVSSALDKAALGEAGKYGFITLYRVFETTDPTVGAFIDEWLAIDPTSPEALSAALTMELHFADIYRGAGKSESVGAKNWERVRNHYANARLYFQKILPKAPGQLYAVSKIFQASVRYGDWETTRISGKLYKDMASDAAVFWIRLHDAQPNWGGSIELMRKLCASDRPQSISAEVCEAKVDVLLWRGVSRERFGQIAAILRDDATDRHQRHISEALIASGDSYAALAFLRKRDAWQDWEQVARVTDATYTYPQGRDTSFLRYSLEKIIAVDPRNPRPLITLAELIREEDIDRAMKLADRAMILGDAMPDVLTARLRIMDMHPVRRWDLGTEIDAVLFATNNNRGIVREISEILPPTRQDIGDPRPGKTIGDGLLSCKRKKAISGLALTCDKSPFFSRSCRQALGDDAIRLFQSELEDKQCLTELPQSYRQEFLSRFLKQESTYCRNIHATTHESTGRIIGKNHDPLRIVCVFYCRNNKFHLEINEARQCDMTAKIPEFETYFKVPTGNPYWKALLNYK